MEDTDERTKNGQTNSQPDGQKDRRTVGQSGSRTISRTNGQTADGIWQTADG